MGKMWGVIQAHKYGIIKILIAYKLIMLGAVLGWAAWKYMQKQPGRDETGLRTG